MSSKLSCGDKKYGWWHVFKREKKKKDRYTIKPKLFLVQVVWKPPQNIMYLQRTWIKNEYSICTSKDIWSFILISPGEANAGLCFHLIPSSLMNKKQLHVPRTRILYTKGIMCVHFLSWRCNWKFFGFRKFSARSLQKSQGLTFNDMLIHLLIYFYPQTSSVLWSNLADTWLFSPQNLH